MGPKSAKECEKRGDIVLLSEIITNSMYWQIIHRKSEKLGANLEYIFNFAGVKRIPIYRHLPKPCIMID
jgi:hypothetical protein